MAQFLKSLPSETTEQLCNIFGPILLMGSEKLKQEKSLNLSSSILNDFIVLFDEIFLVKKNNFYLFSFYCFFIYFDLF